MVSEFGEHVGHDAKNRMVIIDHQTAEMMAAVFILHRIGGLPVVRKHRRRSADDGMGARCNHIFPFRSYSQMVKKQYRLR